MRTKVGLHFKVTVVLLAALLSSAATASAAYTQVTTLAHAPELSEPYGVALLPSGDLIVADAGHHRIVRVSLTGVVTVVAGDGVLGDRDGAAAQAQFKRPVAVAYDSVRDLIYVADTQSDSIRRIGGGTVSTFAATGFSDPMGLTVDSAGNVYVADSGNNRIKKITVAGTVTTVAGTGQAGILDHAQALQAKFNQPNGLVFAASGALYIADQKNHLIRKLENGAVTTVAGNGTNGWVDGAALSAKFREPRGLAFDATGSLLVADSNNNLVRRVTLGAGSVVSTIAGTGDVGYVDGPVASAKFRETAGLAFAGAIYVCDPSNNAVRVIDGDGAVSPAPVVTVQENGVAFADNALLNHNATPVVTVTGVPSYTIVAKIDSQLYTLGTPVTVEGGVHTFDVAVTSGAGVTTTVPTIHFRIDKTAPLVTVTESGSALAGATFDHTITPVVTVQDASTTTIAISIDGNLWTPGSAIAAEGAHLLQGSVTDAAQWTTVVPPTTFVIDKTAPVVRILEGGIVLESGRTFNRPVQPVVDIVDLTTTTTTATLDGQPWTGTAITQDGSHTLTVSVEDRVHHITTVAPIQFTIDASAPGITITSHTEGQVLSLRDVTISGSSDDAVSVKVNGVNATVDPVAKTFTIALTLQEGENAIAVVGTDATGNQSSPVTRKIVLDTRAPEVTIEPLASCEKNISIDLRGTVSDPHIDKLVVKLGDVSTNATINGSNWTATIALGVEGRKSILVEASDTVGHVATEQVTVTVDRTAPTIEIRENGTPFTASIVGHKITLFARASDEDTHVTLTSTLDGAAWTSGSEIAAEGSHALRVIAKDCAGNESTREQTFTIDLTAPRFLTFTPASGSKVTEIPSTLGGTVDGDAQEVRVVARNLSAPVTNGSFSIANVGFAEGVNDLTLEVVDRAGHVGQTSYTLVIKTAKPLVEIVESGDALVDGAVFTRAIAPEIRTFEQSVTATATLDGAPFTSGTAITANGVHTIVATATDSAFGQSNTITRHFTIDRTGPQVTIVAPSNGATIDADRVDVRVTAGDAASVSVNGIAATKQADASWIASVPLDLGENTLVAVAHDAAGNSGSAAVEVTRGIGGPALVLTFPPDQYITNRPKIDVVGRALRPGATVAVTVPPAQSTSVATDPAGTFRLSGATLTEGEWTIVATATADGKSTSVQARVTADFTPPVVRILESGAALEDSAGFATQAVISADATDGSTSVASALTIDGETVSSPVTITANGGHTAIVIARDAAGNESRLERTFYIGSSAASGCRLEVFDPPDQSIVTSQKVELIGRSGGAAGVKVNGVAAKMSNGSFCASVELPQEGANTVTIACTNADGTPVGDPVTITLNRVTNEPSVTITAPLEDFVTSGDTITVTGTLGNGAVSVDLNGKPAMINGATWTVSDVRLTDGLNVLVARARSVGGRIASASRRVTLIQDPPAISISTPVPGFISGISTVDVSGTFANVDPASLVVQGFAGAVQATAWSDTTGKFLVPNVPLQSGDNTIAVTGRDRTGRLARAEVSVRFLSSVPTLSITSPADNDYFGASQGATFPVTGTFNAAEGSSVDVNGVTATVNIAAQTFTADVPFSTLPGGMTPVVARLAQPSGGDGAFDSIRVFKLSDAPNVTETFPAPNAIEVDPGVVVLALFSAPMERQSTLAAFRLENSSGTAVNGKVLVDKDVLTFAPAATLTPGERYTLNVATSAKDLAGQLLAEAVSSTFVVATSAPSQAPTITTPSGRICAQLIDVNGTSLPGARVRLDYGSIFFTTTTSATGAFTYKIPLSGQAGYHVIRVRTIGADGTLSAAAELKLNLDCAGPRVLRASFDRNVNQLTIVFSNDVKAETLTTGAAGSVQLVLPDERVIGGAINVTGSNVVVTPAENLAESTFTLKVTRDVLDQQGRALDAVHTQLFTFGDDEDLPPGYGFISGEAYDATTGRPLAGADITIEAPMAAFSRKPGIAANASPFTLHSSNFATSSRGRYAQAFPEGAHTIRASATGYTTVWRQIVLPAGAGVIPIDIRLTRRGETKTVTSGAQSLVHGGDNAVTRRAELHIPAGAVTSGASITLTSIGAQSLAGLLPLGWSPLASAEIVSSAASLAASTLTFDVPAIPAGQSLSAVRYDESRDEWRVLTPVVNIANGKASLDVSAPGAYALVYGDRHADLTPPPTAAVGAALQGVADPCATAPCPAMVAKGFPLDPEVVLPTESTVATLEIDGASPHIFPSGTAVQAYIDEELHLADGGRELDPPFATDLLLYRDLAGNDGEAIFNLAPSPRAAEVFLEVGFDHIRILPYPGRLDRGTLIGPEGGRVPGDDKVAVEIPTGATNDALLASASSLADAASLGPIAGYTILGGFQLTLDRASQPAPTDIDGDGVNDPITDIELSRPARATFNPQSSILNPQSQLVLVELLDQTPFNNRIFRLAAEMTQLDGGRWTTKTIDRNVLPVDGVIREGRYLLLAANAPIAFARGVTRLGTGAAIGNARVSTPGLGVADLSRVSGIFNVPVPATPAAPFSLVPRIVATGDGAMYTHPSAPAAATVVNVGDLMIVAQPPHVSSTIPANNALNVSLTTSVEAAITPGIDPSSITATSITVIDTTNGSVVAGTAAANGALGVRWTLPAGDAFQPGRRYVAAVAATVRGINGSPLGQAYTFAFTTAASVTNDEVHPERIRITIPDANGVSKVIGTAGALKSGWLAVPVRRGNDFFTRYTAEASSDGSFTVTIGTNARDGVSIHDAIDLRVLNNNGALVALIPLTPFASEDGKAFIAPAQTAVSFTSADGITIDVPAGAFDAATRIDVTPASPAAFNGVPGLAQELIFAGTVDVQFEGRAKVPLQLTIPIAQGTDLTREFFLAALGQSTLGPRLMAVDTLTVVQGKLTTRPSQSNARGLRTNAAGSSAKDLLQKFVQAGQFAAAAMKAEYGTLAWSFLNVGGAASELHWDTLQSMYVGSSYLAEADGAVAFPVPANTKFVITAIDPATSLVAFQQTYDGIPVGAPGTGTPIANPDIDFNGPYPVFATPFRVETITAPPAGVTLKAVRDLEITLSETGVLIVNRAESLSTDAKVSILDVESSERRGPQLLPLSMSDVNAGHRLVIAIDEKDVDPSSTVSVVFNEPIDIGDAKTDAAIDAFLRSVIRFERADAVGSSGVDLTTNALLRLDSSGRRVTILLPSLLEAGARFRLTLDPDITDRSGNNLKLAQAGKKDPSSGAITPIGPAPAPIELWFKTRGPKGTFAEFDLRQTDAAQFGTVREIAQYDNLLFVAAVDGGVLAYDVSDPEALNANSPKPIAIAPGRDSASTGPITEYWSVHVDHHGRVFSTGMSNMFGALRTWRVEDFIKARTNTADGCLPTMKNTVCTQTGGAITSQNPGTAYGVGLASAVVYEDRVEAIPRKAKFLIGDAPSVPYDWATFVTGFCGGSAADAGDGIHQKCNAAIPSSGSNYRMQRITIENVTLGLRWSEDAVDGEPARMMNVIAAPGDEMRITHNLTTYAVISLFGWGIGVFDVNAIESNEVPGTSPSGITRAKEQVALRAYAESPAMPRDVQDVGDLAFSPESHILESNAGTVKVYSLDTRKGVVEFAVTPPDQMDYTGKLVLTGGAHPRFEALKAALVDVGNASPLARFNTGALYRNPNTGKDYLLIAALDYGLIAVEVGATPLTADSFADVVAIADGAYAVRVIDKTNMAAVVDSTGRVLLVDLARVDERDRVSAPNELFPSAANAIADGKQDPRILWRSEQPIAIGNVAPLVDPDTGMLIGADMLGRRVRLASVIDPKLRVTVNVGAADGAPAGASDSLKEVGSVVPLGIEPPVGIVQCDVTNANCRGSLAVFRIEARLPGSMTESLAGSLAVALESESVFGADAPQTPTPYPVAHLRRKKRDGNVDSRATNDFGLKRVLDFAATTIPELRYQKGWNRFASDWIVAIADPRAAKAYGTPPADCRACKRPAYLDSLALSSPNSIREIYTTGRFLSIRPEVGAAGPYAFLAQADRFRKRISTIPADTVRPASVLVAAQAPPIAGGLLQETTYLHSGEVETSNVDLDAGGRAGWNVVIDRTYRSRTIGLTPLAQGWDSSLFRRLRALPNGNVEYRDGAEIWTFKLAANEYQSPAGLSLKLVKRGGGWNLIDQKFRITSFDDLGRLVSESDEFYSPSDAGSGNVVHYAYDEQGRLASVIDPANRASTLTYDANSGLLQKIADWSGSPREIEYARDPQGRLATVKLPIVSNTSGARPQIQYAYSDVGNSYKEQLELRANLRSVIDPGQTAARVEFDYEPNDRVQSQKWGSGETATITYPSPTVARVTDVLGQERVYTITENSAFDVLADRAHMTEIRETAVPVWSGAEFGQLPASITAGVPAVTTHGRVWKFTYADGMQTGAELDGVTKTTVGYTAAPGVAGKLVASTTSGPATGTAAKGIASQSTPWMPADAPITRAFEYQNGLNAASFLKAVTTGSKRIESPEPHRHNAAALQAANDSINATSKYEKNGLFKESASSGGTDTGGAGSKSKIEYFTETSPKYARFLPHFIREGEGTAELTTEITYPSETQTVETDPRGVVTTTDFDAWQRPTHVRVVKPGDPLALETRYEYDAAGRVQRVIEKQGAADVTTAYTYDVMGRRTATTTNNIATVGSVTTSTTYDLANRKTITTQPGGATSTTIVDPLGRPISTSLATGSSPIEQKFAYDLAGNRVYTTDLFIASATAYDSHGRAIATRGADGTITTVKHDESGQPTEIKSLDPSASETISESSYTFSTAGRLESLKAKIDAATTRSTTMVWDGGGRTTGTATGNRASHSTYDIAGRPLLHAAGAGNASALSDIFSKSEITAYSGDLAATTESTEKGGPAIATNMQRDTAGAVTQATTGSLEWKQKYDELGNVTEASAPGRPPAKWDVDARGAVKEETLPDGAKNQYGYHDSGAQTSYTDPTSEATNTVTDLIGRPTSRSYADGTTETITWEGARLQSMTDRQGRTQTYSYNAKGQLEEIRSGAAILDRITYDSAGRMTSWKTADAELTWTEFDLEGRPKRTTQKRFKDASAFTTATVLDEFTQTHAYNEHGERTFASMPTYAGLTLAAGWTRGIVQQYDAMGNVTSIARADAPGASSAVVMSASYRNTGRPDMRTVMTAGGPFVRSYTYDASTSQLKSLSVANANGVFAGSEVSYDGLQIASTRLLGLSSGERYQHWSYDDRSRVSASLYGVKTPDADPTATVPGRAAEGLTPADFREEQKREPVLDSATRATLAQKQIDTTKIDPPTAAFAEQAGHKIAAMTKGPEAFPFAWQGAERIDDGRFTYQFDAKGRLIRATEKATVGPIRSVAYMYSGAGRVVGRRAEYSPSATAPTWQLENRPQILNLDGLPADTTFVWDPIADRLISVFKAGATPTTDTNGGLLKQIIHGDASYDDPLETATIDPANGVVTHLYPIYDEAGAGSLQAVVNTNGEVIARNLSKDPYGADDVALAGAAIDGIKVEVKKTSGTIDTVIITLHATEQLAESTIATGARLAAVDSNGALVRTTPVPPIRVDDHFALQWTLTSAQWSALTDPTPVTVDGQLLTATHLSIAATAALRAINWSTDLPLLPAPDWVQATKPVFTSAALPIEIREPLNTLSTFITAIPPDGAATSNLYEIDALSLLGNPSGPDSLSEDILSARMHAHPFTEPVTGLNYVRNRWYEPGTGTWLSPDPKGYVDSSNLYAFTGGDPINRRDPTGEDAYDYKYQAYFQWYLAQQAEIGRQYNAAQARYRQAVNTGDALGSAAEVDYWRSRNGTFSGGIPAAQTWFEFQRKEGNAKALLLSNEQIHAEVFGDEIAATFPLVFVPVIASVNQIRGMRSRAPQAAPIEPEMYGPPAPKATEIHEPPAPAPYQNRRPHLRATTVKRSWDTAPEGTAPSSRACPTCGNDVFGNPHTGELRNTPKGWDVEHIRKWEIIRRELQARNASPTEYRTAYNDLNNTILRCRSCNRADNKVSD